MTTVQPTQKLAVDLLRAESRVSIARFTLNQTLANPEKFQAIFINCVENDIKIEIDRKWHIIVCLTNEHIKTITYFLEFLSDLCMSDVGPRPY